MVHGTRDYRHLLSRIRAYKTSKLSIQNLGNQKVRYVMELLVVLGGGYCWGGVSVHGCGRATVGWGLGVYRGADVRCMSEINKDKT